MRISECLQTAGLQTVTAALVSLILSACVCALPERRCVVPDPFGGRIRILQLSLSSGQPAPTTSSSGQVRWSLQART